MSKKQFSVRLETNLYEQLENYRWEKRISLNEAVTEAVTRFLAESGNAEKRNLSEQNQGNNGV